MCSFAVRSSAFLGRTPASRGLIRDIAPLSAAYFADGRPTEFLVGTGRLRSVSSGQVIGRVRLGGLHHRYDPAAESKTVPSFVERLRRFSRNLSTPVSLRPRSPIHPRIPAPIILRRHKSDLELSYFVPGLHCGERQP